METIWDWLTVIGFAGLITLFLQRSSAEEPVDELWHYAPPAIGCAVINYVGNEGMNLAAIALSIAVILYVFKVLRPSIPRF